MASQYDPKRIIEHEHAPKCFVLVSFSLRSGYPEQCDPCVSFLYRGDSMAVEWEVQHGPIQRWMPGTEPHYAIPSGVDLEASTGEWSQLAVDDNGLPAAASRGDFDHIFRVLKRWAGEE